MIFLISFSLLNLQQVNAEETAESNIEKKIESEEMITLEDYEEYLKEQGTLDEEYLEEVNNLSEEEEEKFLDYMSNPEKLVEALEDENNHDVMLEEDLEIPVEIAESGWLGGIFDNMFLNVAEAATTRQVGYVYKLKVAGITTTSYTVKVRYSVSGTSVKKIVGREAYVSRNANPVVQTSKVSHQAYVGGNRAKTVAKFNYKIGPIKGLSAQLGIITVRVEGNYKGTRTKAYGTRSS